MYSEHEIRMVLECWDDLRETMEVTDGFLATVDVQMALESMSEEEQQLAEYVISGQSAAEISILINKSISTVERKRKRLIKDICRLLNDGNF